MNLSQLRTRVRSLTSILATSVLSDAELDDYINEAHTQFCLAADWPFLIHTATVTFDAGDDVASVSLPASRTAQRVIDVYAYRETGSKPWQLHERAQPEIAESTTGKPVEYSWDAEHAFLTVYPVPSPGVTARIRVVLDPRSMTAGTDVPLLPTAFRHGVAYLAAAAVLEREADQTGRAQTYSRKAGEVLSDMRRLLLTSGRPSFTLGGRVSQRRSARRQAW